MKGVIGTGVSGSKGEGPGTVNIQREPLLSAVNIFKYYLRVGHERYGGERNDRKGERKDRETPRGKENGGRAWWSREAARARSSSATHSSRQHTRCRLALPRGMDPESFTYEEKESCVRFAPFMVRRSCALEPRSEMQGPPTPTQPIRPRAPPTCCWWMARYVSITFSPRNGTPPTRSSCSSTPSAQICAASPWP